MSAISCSLNWSPNGGIEDWPLVTRLTTRAVSRLASWSSDGPICPVAPASANAWQLPHVAPVNSTLPFAGSPAADGAAAWLARA